MMENLILGPITLYRTDAERKIQIRELLNEGWLPIYSRSSGKLVDELKGQLNKVDQLQFKGLIVCIGYKILPKE